jgi:PAS domain S-box-containing protein
MNSNPTHVPKAQQDDPDVLPRARQELLASESILRLITENVDDLIVLMDTQGNRLYTSPSYQRILGDKGRPEDPFQHIHPDDRDKIKRIFLEVIASGRGQRTEYRYQLQDGSVRHIESQSSVILDQNGAVQNVLVVSRDTSERKNTLQALRDSEIQLMHILDTALDAVVGMDQSGRVVHWNPEAERMFGYSASEAIGSEMADLIVPPAYRTRHREGLQRFLQSGSGPVLGVRVEISAMRADGSEFEIELAIAIPTLMGKNYFFSAFIRDISERKQAEANIRLLNQNLELRIAARTEQLRFQRDVLVELAQRDKSDFDTALLDILRAAAVTLKVERASYWCLDPSGDWIECRQLFIHSGFGIDSDASGMRLFRSDFPDYFAAIKQSQTLAADDACAHPATSAFSEPYLKPLGITSMLDAAVWFHESVVGVTCFEHVGEKRCWSPEEVDFAASIATMIALALEASNRARTEVELALMRDRALEASKLKSEFLANMSHEIRTPMNAIIGLSYLALKTEMTAKQRDYVSKIHRAGTALLGIINDILDFSKIEADKLVVESLDFDLEEVLDNVSILVGHKAGDKGLELLYKIPADIPRYLVGDPLRLWQILVNLLNNAVKFTEQGEIEIAAELLEQDNDRVKLRFTVRDTGIGMTPEQSERLFQAFSQADGSTTRKYGGTGLGLSISKRLVELMDGEIFAESEAGQGSRFIFSAWFGLLAETAGRQRVLPQNLEGLRVLVVDDNPTAREIMQEMLLRFPFAVDTACSGQAAVAAVKDCDSIAAYDLVLMDLNMPGINGIEAARLIKRDTALIAVPRVVMLTAFDNDDARRQAEDVWIDGFLIKPVSESVLFDAVVNYFAVGASGDVIPTGVDSLRQSGLEDLHILLVEDNEINQQIVVELLQSAGVIIDVANNGREAVEKVLVMPHSYDAILMDLQMPEMGGFEATRIIRADARFADIPILAMTAHALDEERERCFTVGMNDHITKPVDPDILFQALARWAKRERQPIKHNAVFAQSALQIPGIDSDAGLRRVAGNQKLYLSLLRQFCQSQGDAVDRISAALAEQDFTSAGRIVHTIKGVAGNIGAVAAQEQAVRLETLIREDASLAALQRVLQEFDAVIATLIGYINLIPGIVETETPLNITALDRDAFKLVLAKLVDYLSDDDSEAIDYFDSVRDQFRIACNHAEFASLDKAIHEFEFSQALQQLCALSDGDG